MKLPEWQKIERASLIKRRTSEGVSLKWHIKFPQILNMCSEQYMCRGNSKELCEKQQLDDQKI